MSHQIKELLKKWIANEGPNGGIKGTIYNNINELNVKQFKELPNDEKGDEIREEYCTLFFVLEACLKVFRDIVEKHEK